MKQARRIYEGGEAYALAIYCGGLAVESLLRAFRWQKDASFEGRHDLAELLKASGLMRIGDEYMRNSGASELEIQTAGIKLRTAIQEVIRVWRNDLRFASEASLRAFLNEMHRLQGIKGNPLKKNAMDMLSAAQTVIDRGEILWTSKKKS